MQLQLQMSPVHVTLGFLLAFLWNGPYVLAFLKTCFGTARAHMISNLQFSSFKPAYFWDTTGKEICSKMVAGSDRERCREGDGARGRAALMMRNNCLRGLVRVRWGVGDVVEVLWGCCRWWGCAGGVVCPQVGLVCWDRSGPQV